MTENNFKFPEFNGFRVIIVGVFVLLLFFPGFCAFFDLFPDYLFLIEMACWRLLFLLTLLCFYHILRGIPFFMDLSGELKTFDEGPSNKSWFIAVLRRFHVSMLGMGSVFYTIALVFF